MDSVEWIWMVGQGMKGQRGMDLELPLRQSHRQYGQFGTKLHGTKTRRIFGWGTIFEWIPPQILYQEIQFGTANGNGALERNGFIQQ